MSVIAPAGAFPLAPRDMCDMRIALVDDQPANLLLLEAVLRRAGFRCVRSTTDPRGVVAAVLTSPPDLLVLDLNMPHVDGMSLLGELDMGLPSEEFVPRLVITADVTASSRHRALAAGAHDFLTKPFDAFDVALRATNLLRIRQLNTRLSIHRTELEQRVRQRTSELEAARVELLERLARAAEFRDDDTAQHTFRVGTSAAALARAAGLAHEDVESLRAAAPLHDIGKIGVSDAVLLKPGRLTEDEFAHIKTHAELGARILSGSSYPLLQVAEQIALAHHERFDGTGYPYGLAGEGIPLVARIVALADVFDALTHERPYKQAWPIEKAVEEMRRGRGTHFDPELLDLFLVEVAPSVLP